jgi:hypothetical protein
MGWERESERYPERQASHADDGPQCPRTRSAPIANRHLTTHGSRGASQALDDQRRQNIAHYPLPPQPRDLPLLEKLRRANVA